MRANPKPKPRTIRAWAVVCADGKWREPTATASAKMAREEGSYCDSTANYCAVDCGGRPHTIVALTGTYTPKGKG